MASSSLADAVSTLREATDALDDAAWREGIEPDGALGLFVGVMRTALYRLADLSARTESTMGSNIDAVRLLAEQELLKLRQMTDAAGVAVRQARQAQINLELERELIATRLVEHLGPQIAEGVKHWRIIKETEFNRRQARRRAVLTAAAALALVTTGYLGRAWEDRISAAAFAHCLAHRVTDQTGQHQYCDLADLAPPR